MKKILLIKKNKEFPTPETACHHVVDQIRGFTDEESMEENKL